MRSHAGQYISLRSPKSSEMNMRKKNNLNIQGYDLFKRRDCHLIERMDDQWTIDKMWTSINVTMWRCFDIFVGFLNRAHMVFPACDIGKLMRCTEFGVVRNKFGLVNRLNHSHDIRKKRPAWTLSICISLTLSLSLLAKSIIRIDDALLWMLWLTNIKCNAKSHKMSFIFENSQRTATFHGAKNESKN